MLKIGAYRSARALSQVPNCCMKEWSTPLRRRVTWLVALFYGVIVFLGTIKVTLLLADGVFSDYLQGARDLATHSVVFV